MPIGAKMYEAAGQENAGNDDAGNSDDKGSDGPVEGEVVDDKKD